MSYLGLANMLAHSGEIASLLSAAKLTPDDASLWQRAGLKLLEIAPDRAHAYLERAFQLNPRDADALLGLAFLREKSGKIIEAEPYYLEATRVSRRYRPNYSLATYYFRHDRPALFWPTAARVAAIDRANLENLFRIAHLMSDSPRQVPALLKLGSQHARTSYLTFLLKEENLDKIASLDNLADAAQGIVQPRRIGTCSSQRVNDFWIADERPRLPHLESAGSRGGFGLHASRSELRVGAG
jgi:tetratricopeptide (TPR) repeat protein